MITGSHIPFDRNGIKFYSASGEITKADETAIADAVVVVPKHGLLAELPAGQPRCASYVHGALSRLLPRRERSPA